MSPSNRSAGTIALILMADADNVDEGDDDDSDELPIAEALLVALEPETDVVAGATPPLFSSRPGVRLFSRGASRASRCNSCAAADDCFFLKYLLIVLVLEVASFPVSFRLWLDLELVAPAVWVAAFANCGTAEATATRLNVSLSLSSASSSAAADAAMAAAAAEVDAPVSCATAEVFSGEASSSSSSSLLDVCEEGSGSGSGSVKRSFRFGPRLDGGDENERS